LAVCALQLEQVLPCAYDACVTPDEQLEQLEHESQGAYDAVHVEHELHGAQLEHVEQLEHDGAYDAYPE